MTLIAWLDAVRVKRDFSLPFDGDDAASPEQIADIRALVAAAAAELHGFGRLVSQADAALARNAEQLALARSSAERYRSLVVSASELLEQMKRLSNEAASGAHALQGESVRAMDAVTGATELLSTESERENAALSSAIGEVAGSSRTLRGESQGLLTFVTGVARLSRQAGLLSTNARIEAAHLGQSGKGFAIVANEVRTLAESTKEAVRDIGSIAHRLAEATEMAVGSTADASAAATDLGSMRRRVGEAVALIEQTAAGFTEPVESIAAMADQHQHALPGIVNSFENVTEMARGIAAAAQEASELDVATKFNRVHELLDGYRFGPIDERARRPQRAFDGELQQAVEAFDASIASTEREILDTIVRGAVSVARNSFLWLSIATKVRELESALRSAMQMIAESGNASRSLVESSRRMQSLAGELRSETDIAVERLRDAATLLERVRENVAHVGDVVDDMSAALDRAGTILALVDEISAETNLLALNAAIEAAHAGEAGLGFSVIAGEIRKLADGTHRATDEVSRTLEEVAHSGEMIRTGTERSAQLTQTVEERGSAVREAVVDLVERMNQAVSRSLSLAALADQQMRAYAGLRTEMEGALQAIDANLAAATDVRRLELAEVGQHAFALAAQRRLGIFAEQMRGWGLELAAEMDGVFDQALERHAITLADCRDTSYQLIAGARIAELRRLFNVDLVPPEGFTPPKFSTKYDRAVEAGINAIIDRWVPIDAKIKAMFAVDLNGYCFGHYRECRQDWTGDYQRDLNHNRIKRFFEDPLSLRCSRVGLGAAAHALPGRTSFEAFAAAGCTLAREAGERPWAIYTYARDTGIVYNDLSLAIFARGQRVGTIRIIYDADTL